MQFVTTPTAHDEAQLHLEGGLRGIRKRLNREVAAEPRRLVRDLGNFDPLSGASRPHAACI